MVSSTASSLVACALILRVPRGPRRPGVRTSGVLADSAAGAGAARSQTVVSEGLICWMAQGGETHHCLSYLASVRFD